MPKAQNNVNTKGYGNCRWTPFETSRDSEGRCLGHGMKSSRSRLDHRRQTVRTHPNRILPLKSRKGGVSNTIARYFQSCENTSAKLKRSPQSISLTSDEISELNNLLMSLSLGEVRPGVSALQDAAANPPLLQDQEELNTTIIANSTNIPKTNASSPVTISPPETGLIVQPGADAQLYNLFEKTKSNDPFLTRLFNEYNIPFDSDNKDYERDNTTKSQVTVQGMSLFRDHMNLSPAAQIVVLILLLMDYSSEIPKLLIPKNAFTTTYNLDQPSPFLKPIEKDSSIIPVEIELEG